MPLGCATCRTSAPSRRARSAEPPSGSSTAPFVKGAGGWRQMVEPLRLDNIILQVPDVGAAVQWYRCTAGLTPVLVTPEVAVLHPADGGAGVVLRRGDGAGRSTVWFEVADAAAAGRELGVEPFEIGTGLCAQVRDPWGNTVGFADYSTAGRGGAPG